MRIMELKRRLLGHVRHDLDVQISGLLTWFERECGTRSVQEKKEALTAVQDRARKIERYAEQGLMLLERCGVCGEPAKAERLAVHRGVVRHEECIAVASPPAEAKKGAGER